MCRGMAEPRTADLMREQLLLEVQILVRRHRSKRCGMCVGTKARVDVESAVKLERQVIATGDGADHVDHAGHLCIHPSPDAVAAVARIAGLLMGHEAARVMGRGERAVIALNA